MKMNEHEKNMKGLVIVEQVEDNTETRLEGARAKIEILQDHIAVQDERLRQLIVAVRSIRGTLGDLPEN